MDNFIDSLRDNPGKTFILGFSAIAATWGIVSGIQTGKFNPDPKQAALEASLTADVERDTRIKTSTEKANARYDRNCTGVFQFRVNENVYAPLTEGVGVLSGDFAQRVDRLKSTKQPVPKPARTDYLPAGMEVCDAYGNTAILEGTGKTGEALITDIASTGDQGRIKSMTDRYPGFKPNLVKSNTNN